MKFSNLFLQVLKNLVKYSNQNSIFIKFKISPFSELWPTSGLEVHSRKKGGWWLDISLSLLPLSTSFPS